MNPFSKIRPLLKTCYVFFKNHVIHAFSICIAAASYFCFEHLFNNWQQEWLLSIVKTIGYFISGHQFVLELSLALIVLFLVQITGLIVYYCRKGSVAVRSGMFLYRPNDTRWQVKKSIMFLRDASKDSVYIHILSATGWETFGSPDSPLYEGMKACEEAKVILVHPLSEQVIKRTKDLDFDLDEYRNEIYDSIKYLNGLVGSGCKIKLKIYRGYPLWKYIILQQYVWIQQYPRDEHVQISACYAFQRRPIPNRRGIYQHINNQFSMRWDNHHLGVYNFSTNKLEFCNRNGKPITTGYESVR